jgi:hypothetical protein
VHARGKRLVTLNLRSAAGQELYLRLVERADPPHEWLNVKIIESGDLERNRSPDDPLIRGQRSNSEARKDLGSGISAGQKLCRGAALGSRTSIPTHYEC